MDLSHDRTSGVPGRAWPVNVLNLAARWRLWDGGRWGTDNPRYKGGDYFGAAARSNGVPQADPAPAWTAVPAGLGPGPASPALPSTAWNS
jgi:hypothetical protein